MAIIANVSIYTFCHVQEQHTSPRREFQYRQPHHIPPGEDAKRQHRGLPGKHPREHPPGLEQELVHEEQRETNTPHDDRDDDLARRPRIRRAAPCRAQDDQPDAEDEQDRPDDVQGCESRRDRGRPRAFPEEGSFDEVVAEECIEQDVGEEYKLKG